MYVIEFAPPMGGFVGTFNTIRVGMTWSRRLTEGMKVALMDKKHSLIFGYATVCKVECGALGDIAQRYAHENHNQKGLDPEGAPERLMQSMMKRHGPHIITPTKKACVIYLRMNE